MYDGQMPVLPASEHTLSELLRRSGEVIQEADDHAVRINRRDGNDLVIMRADQVEGVRETFEISTGILKWIAEREPAMLDDLLLEVFPWVKFLPEEDRRDFAAEFITSLRASVAVGSFDQLQTEILQWRNTAFVWSKPGVLHAVQRIPDAESAGEAVPDPEEAASV